MTKNTEDVMRSNFNIMYEKVILPLVKIYKKKYGLRVGCFSKYLMRYKYCKEANFYIQSYMVTETAEIDKHKISACLLKSILFSKPLKISLFKKIKIIFDSHSEPDTFFLANEYLAVSCAISVLESYIEADEKELSHGITFPIPFPNGANDYVKDLCLSLYYTKSRKINVMAYANIFFLLEKYSCRRTRCKNLREYIKQCNSNLCDEDVDKIEVGKFYDSK